MPAGGRPGVRAMLAAVATLRRDGRALRRAPPPLDRSFTMEGARHAAALYTGDGRRPGVLLAHTAAGLGRHDRALALRLAGEGFAALVVRYARRTSGRLLAHEPRRERALRILAAALERLRADPRVLPGRVGMLGLSLGGHFAVRLAGGTQSSGAVPAVVWYGIQPGTLPFVTDAGAPLLIVQGERDAPSFVRAAREAARLAGPRAALVMCDGPHQFDLFDPGGAATGEAWRRTIAFFRERL